MPIPDFVGDPHPYWLPAGTYRCTIEEIEERLVYNEVRVKVWRYFRSMLDRVHDLGGEIGEIFIDGSFVTGRAKPSDIDAVCMIPQERFMRMIADSPGSSALRFILTRPHEARELFGAHLFCTTQATVLNNMRLTFTRGLAGRGLRAADPDRDPPGLIVPQEKGILSVDLTSFFSTI